MSDEPKSEMPKYQCHKKVWALQIITIDHHRITVEAGYAPILCPVSMFARYQPQPGDYYVVYEDGYTSFSPKKAFEDGYTRIEG